MKFTPNKNVKIGFAFSVFILVITSLISWFSIRELIERSGRVDHTNTVLVRLGNVMSFSKDAETAMRGYLLTNDKEFLQPYYGSQEKVLKNYRELRHLTADNPVQQNRLDILKKMIDKRYLIIKNTLDLHQYGRMNEAIDKVALKEGKICMDVMRNIVIQMEKEEELLLQSRVKAARYSSAFAPVVIIFASLTAILVAVFSFIKIMRDIQKRIKAEQELELSNTALEESYEELAVREEQLREMNLQLEIKAENKNNDLLESERRYRFMSESIPAIVWTSNPNGELDYYSKKWTDLTGFTLEETYGWGWGKVIHPDDLQRTIDAWSAVLESGKEYKIEHRVKGKDGIYRWLLTRAVPLKDHEGKIIKWFGTAVDIEDEKAASERLKLSEEKYRLLSESIPQLVWTTDAQGRMDYVNINWLSYTGQTIDVALKAGLVKALHPDERVRVMEGWLSAVQSGKNYNAEYKLKNHMGVYRWFLGKARPIKNEYGKVVKWFGTTTDIHDQKTTQQILKQKNDELMRINNDLDNFIYTASHDLKAPISNIEGLLYTLNDSVCTEPIDRNDLSHIASLMKVSTERFKHTIEDLTEITKLQKDIGEDIEIIYLKDVLNEVTETIGDLIRISNVKIAADFNCVQSIVFSKKNIRSIFYNLISNAIKFRNLNRQAEVQLKTEKEGNYTVLTVKDNGLGIPSQHIDKIFIMFKRAHDHVEGTGVGLYIVKRIIDNAGGRIEVESEPGKGSVFKVYFCNDH